MGSAQNIIIKDVGFPWQEEERGEGGGGYDRGLICLGTIQCQAQGFRDQINVSHWQIGLLAVRI